MYVCLSVRVNAMGPGAPGGEKSPLDLLKLELESCELMWVQGIGLGPLGGQDALLTLSHLYSLYVFEIGSRSVAQARLEPTV